MIDLIKLTRELTKKWGEDAAQHAVLKILERGWDKDPGTNEVEHFAKVVAKNYRLDEHKRAQRHREIGPVNEPHSRKDEALLRAEARQELRRAPRTRLLMAHLGGPETAKVLGVALGTIKSRVNRGRI